MVRESADDSIEFRVAALKEAATALDDVHLGGFNGSELVRDGLSEMV